MTIADIYGAATAVPYAASTLVAIDRINPAPIAVAAITPLGRVIDVRA